MSIENSSRQIMEAMAVFLFTTLQKAAEKSMHTVLMVEKTEHPMLHKVEITVMPMYFGMYYKETCEADDLVECKILCISRITRNIMEQGLNKEQNLNGKQ